MVCTCIESIQRSSANTLSTVRRGRQKLGDFCDDIGFVEEDRRIGRIIIGEERYW